MSSKLSTNTKEHMQQEHEVMSTSAFKEIEIEPISEEPGQLAVSEKALTLIEKFVLFIQNRTKMLQPKDWLILGLLFLFVDEFRGAVVGLTALIVVFNFLLLRKSPK